MNLSGTSIIGRTRALPNARAFSAYNPALGAPLAPDFFAATVDELERAVSLAVAASATYGRATSATRAAFLHLVARKLEEESSTIIARAQAETALPDARLQGELARTSLQLRLLADIARDGGWADPRIDHGDPHRQPTPKPELRSMLRPLGPVVVFGVSNFPLAFSVAGGDTAAALAAGNPVIVKAHPAHPGTSELVGRLIQDAVAEAGLPEGVFSLLFDDGIEIGQTLVRHPSIRAVAFTGSRRAGRALMDLASSRSEPIPVLAEMGSINPIFLLPTALEAGGRAIASGLHASVTLGVGQFCTNPGLVVARDGSSLELCLGHLAVLMAQTAPGPMLTPRISEAYRQGIDRLTSKQGVLTLSRVDTPAGAPLGGAALCRTTARALLADGDLVEEVFGPATLVVECKSDEELSAVAQSLEGQLTASVHGTDADLSRYEGLISVLEAKVGRVIFNGFPTSVEVGHAIVHGGPYPATSDGRFTSVGGRAIARFARPLCYQNAPDRALPDELKDKNPLGVARRVDGKLVDASTTAPRLSGATAAALQIFARNVPASTSVLQASTVAIAGCGGLGSNAAVALTRAGVGNLILADFDFVGAANLNRQHFFQSDIGKPKIVALAAHLRAINPDVGLELLQVELTPDSVSTFFAKADLLIEAFDRADCKHWLIESWCRAFPKRKVICASGLSGLGNTEALTVQRAGHVVVCGDQTSDLREGLCAARVAIVANMQANLAIETLVAENKV
jgi:2,5-dioxopentanoate dehydrogenase